MELVSEWKRVDRDVRDTLGEGTLWSARDNAVYWVDIRGPALNRLSLTDGDVQRWTMPEPLGWVAESRGGGFVAGLQSGFARLTLDPLVIEPFGDPEPHLPGNRMNDGKADADGRIWCGTMDMAEEQDSGSLYRLDALTLDVREYAISAEVLAVDVDDAAQEVWVYLGEAIDRTAG